MIDKFILLCSIPGHFHLQNLNYDTHDKELLTIYEAFWTWRHYLEGSAPPIDVVTVLSTAANMNLLWAPTALQTSHPF